MKKPYKNIRWAIGWLALLVFVALFQEFLANEKPIYCKHQGQIFFPALHGFWSGQEHPFTNKWLDSIRIYKSWKYTEYENVIFAPIPFGADESLRQNPLNSARPGTIHPGLKGCFRHLLGTDSQGFDVAASLINGARIALLTGTTAMMIALSFGLFFGAVAGYFGDEKLSISRGRLGLTLFSGSLMLFYGLAVPWKMMFPGISASFWGPLAAILILSALSYAVDRLFKHYPVFSHPILIPADLITMRLVEIFNGIPGIIVIITLATAIRQQSRWLMIAMIGFLSWPNVAKLVRAELLRIRELDYIAAARTLGLRESRILFHHALPNALRPAMVTFSLGMGAAIVMEAALSFLGFGGEQQQSWGVLLLRAQEHLNDWWVLAPPGLSIALTVLALNRIGDYLAEKQT